MRSRRATVGRLSERIGHERAANETMQATRSIVAHDLRTPLHTIRMGSDLLSHRPDADVRRHAAIIERSSSMRAASLVHDALDAMRLGDGARIAQLLANLLANAVRLTPRGGTIAVVAEDEDDVDKVFTKSWTKGGGGMGRGLWIARSVVEAHARTLSVSSAEGRGTSFTFSLPSR